VMPMITDGIIVLSSRRFGRLGMAALPAASKKGLSLVDCVNLAAGLVWCNVRRRIRL
jgi:hypothetical protein